MDNDFVENAHWPKLPSTVDFFFCLFAPDKGLGAKKTRRNREVKCCGCDRKMDQRSGLYDTAKKNHIEDNARLTCPNTRLLHSRPCDDILGNEDKIEKSLVKVCFRSKLTPLHGSRRFSRCHCSDITLCHTGCQDGGEAQGCVTALHTTRSR